jgi:formiminotetrahydrofolate cyclodeaminase
MKRFVVSISGLLVVMYLGAVSAAAQRIQGRGATANGSEHTQAPAISKSEAAKAGSKTPGELLAQNKKLSDKLSRILKQQNPPITDLQAASQGFNILGVFVAAVHISHNLGIPFDQLKTAAQTNGSYSKAIHALRPDADDKAELRKAAMQAVEDIQQSQRRS